MNIHLPNYLQAPKTTEKFLNYYWKLFLKVVISDLYVYLIMCFSPFLFQMIFKEHQYLPVTEICVQRIGQSVTSTVEWEDKLPVTAAVLGRKRVFALKEDPPLGMTLFQLGDDSQNKYYVIK